MPLGDLREQLQTKYFFRALTDAQVTMLLRAEAEIAECEGCTGDCQKRCPDYFVPVIGNVAGHPQITAERCKFFVPPAPKPQAVTPPDTPMFAFMRDLRAQFEERRKNWQAKKLRERARILKQYGLRDATDADIGKILAAEDENAKCEGCNGESCHKKIHWYRRDKVICDEKGVRVEKVKCKVQLAADLKAATRQCFIPGKYRGKPFADYEVTRDNKDAIAAAKWFTPDVAQSLYLYGNTGTGKTFLASIIAQEWLRRGKSVVFGDVPALLTAIKNTFDKDAPESAEKVFARYVDCDLLVLDDFGAGQVTEWNIGKLYELINARYSANKPLLVTSNFDIKGLERRLKSGDDFAATRIISRLAEMCVPAFLGMNDRRR